MAGQLSEFIGARFLQPLQSFLPQAPCAHLVLGGVQPLPLSAAILNCLTMLPVNIPCEFLFHRSYWLPWIIMNSCGEKLKLQPWLVLPNEFDGEDRTLGENV